MDRRFALVILLAGCGTAPEIPSATANDLSADQLSRLDVRGTAASISMIADEVRALPPLSVKEASESLQVLLVHCPYTRAALHLPFILHAAVMDIDADSLDPLVQRDWAYLQEGLGTHVDVLGMLGVEFRTLELNQGITTAAKQVDEPTRALIDHHSDRVEALTGVGRPCPRGPWSVLPGQSWNLGMQLGGWHDALRRVQPFVDADAREDIDALVALLDVYVEATQESVAAQP